MKVILLRDVAKLGKRNTVATVPDGYAQNKLIPTGLALPATPANLKRLERAAAEASTQATHDAESFQTALKTLQASPITLTADANAQGGLFQAIKASDIASALVRAGVHGVPIDAIQLPAPLKTSGEHVVELKFAGLAGQCQLVIEAKS